MFQETLPILSNFFYNMKTKDFLEKAIEFAQSLGMVENGRDFGMIISWLVNQGQDECF